MSGINALCRNAIRSGDRPCVPQHLARSAPLDSQPSLLDCRFAFRCATRGCCAHDCGGGSDRARRICSHCRGHPGGTLPGARAHPFERSRGLDPFGVGASERAAAVGEASGVSPARTSSVARARSARKEVDETRAAVGFGVHQIVGADAFDSFDRFGKRRWDEHGNHASDVSFSFSFSFDDDRAARIDDGHAADACHDDDASNLDDDASNLNDDDASNVDYDDDAGLYSPPLVSLIRGDRASSIRLDAALGTRWRGARLSSESKFKNERRMLTNVMTTSRTWGSGIQSRRPVIRCP